MPQGIHVTAYSPLGSEVPEGQPSPMHDETIKKVRPRFPTGDASNLTK